MASDTEIRGGRPRPRWTLAVWAAAGLLLLAPAVAMQVSESWAWGPFDFLLLGVLLAAACAAVELAARAAGGWAYRAGVGVAVVAAVLLIWINLAVGIIGDEGNPANLMFGAVLLVAAGGAAFAGFRARGLAWAMAAAALAQAAVAGFALAQGLAHPLPLSAGFTALWLAAAALFWRAGR